MFEEKAFCFYAGKTQIGHSEGFFEGAKPFLPIWVQNYVQVLPYALN